MELDQEVKEYEISFLAPTEMAGQEIGSLLVKLGAEVLLNGPVRQINLAYPIEKHKGAFFGYYHFRIVPEKIINLKNELALNKEIIRFLIVTPAIKKSVDRSHPPMERSERTERPIAPKKIVEVNKAPVYNEESKPEILSNELLEKKLEEILK